MEKLIPSEEEVLLRYGKYLVDENMEFCEEEIFTCMRIRIIKYDNDLYYHKMLDGVCVEFRRLG